MKKILSILLCILIFNSFASCQNAPPEGEVKATKTITVEHDLGVKMEIVIDGYKNESIGEEFYVKSNEAIPAKAIVTNTSDQPIYQYLPTWCRHENMGHNHEVSYSLYNKDDMQLTPGWRYETCPALSEIWELPPQKSETFTIELIAGTNWYDGGAGGEVPDISYFTLYDESIYMDGFCEFSGTISFGDFMLNKEAAYTERSTFSVDVSLNVMYVEYVEPQDTFEADLSTMEVHTGECMSLPEKESSTNSDYMAENKPWLYSPDCWEDYYEKGYYDYEVTMETTVFDEFPEKLQFTITNHTENKFYYIATFIEKLDYYFLPPYEYTPQGWRRVPFYEHPEAKYLCQYEKTKTLVTENYVQSDYEFTPGKYRLVVFVSGGPQYIYFTIVE